MSRRHGDLLLSLAMPLLEGSPADAQGAIREDDSGLETSDGTPLWLAVAGYQRDFQFKRETIRLVP